LNVVLDPNVHGTLTIVLDDVPWDQALDIVLKNNDLDPVELEGNVLRIATVDTLKGEADARRAQGSGSRSSGGRQSHYDAFPRLCSTRRTWCVTVKKFLSASAEMSSADDRTNAVIISDIPKA
jgi:type IV pilus assembly protein PilQ